MKKKKRRVWNYGKRKPFKDEFSNKWCNCLYPKLIHNIAGEKGQAYCLLCHTNWYH